MKKETVWAVTEISHQLPSGELLKLTCAPKFPEKPIYSLELAKKESIIFQINADSLSEIKELVKAISEAVGEFKRHLDDSTLFDDAIGVAKQARIQVAVERSKNKFSGISINRSQVEPPRSLPATSLLGATTGETK